jgi:rod shape-determining protein MreD
VIARALLVGVLLVAAAVLETAFFPLLPLLGYRPDLLVLVVVGIALRDGPLAGVRVGAAAGILGDVLVTGSPVGLALLVYVAVGYAAGTVRPYLAPDSITAPILVAFSSALLATGAYGIFTSLLAEQRLGARGLLASTLAVALTTTLLAPLVFLLTERVTARFPLQGQLAAD